MVVPNRLWASYSSVPSACSAEQTSWCSMARCECCSAQTPASVWSGSYIIRSGNNQQRDVLTRSQENNSNICTGKPQLILLAISAGSCMPDRPSLAPALLKLPHFIGPYAILFNAIHWQPITLLRVQRLLLTHQQQVIRDLHTIGSCKDRLQTTSQLTCRGRNDHGMNRHVRLDYAVSPVMVVDAVRRIFQFVRQWCRLAFHLAICPLANHFCRNSTTHRLLPALCRLLSLYIHCCRLSHLCTCAVQSRDTDACSHCGLDLQRTTEAGRMPCIAAIDAAGYVVNAFTTCGCYCIIKTHKNYNSVQSLQMQLSSAAGSRLTTQIVIQRSL